MKKTILSTLAVAAMALVMVACGNGKMVDAQVKSLNALTEKMATVATVPDFQAAAQEYDKVCADWSKAIEKVKLTPEEVAKVEAATAAYTAKTQEKAEGFAKAAAEEAAAAAKAAEEAKLAEEAAAKTAPKGKK